MGLFSRGRDWAERRWGCRFCSRESQLQHRWVGFIAWKQALRSLHCVRIASVSGLKTCAGKSRRTNQARLMTRRRGLKGLRLSLNRPRPSRTSLCDGGKGNAHVTWRVGLQGRCVTLCTRKQSISARDEDKSDCEKRGRLYIPLFWMFHISPSNPLSLHVRTSVAASTFSLHNQCITSMTSAATSSSSHSIASSTR